MLPLVALATVATVMASQALISGAFSLTMQAAQLGFLPRLRIDHTSDRQYGQVYVPAVNVALLAGCVAVVVGFGSSANLAGAYGIAVTSTMVITTVLLATVARRRWGWPPALVVLTGAFLVVDLAFFSANLAKVASGGWFPLMVGLALFVVMTTWFRGRRAVAERRRLGSSALADFVAEIGTGVTRVPGSAIYFGADLGRTPSALEAALWHERLFALMHRNAASVVRYFRLPRNRIVEVGAVVEI